MNDDTDRALLIAELEGDLEALPELLESNTKSMERINAGAADELDYAALGYTLHNLYNLMEKLLLLQKRLPDMVSSWKTAIANFIDLLKTL